MCWFCCCLESRYKSLKEVSKAGRWVRMFSGAQTLLRGGASRTVWGAALPGPVFSQMGQSQGLRCTMRFGQAPRRQLLSQVVHGFPDPQPSSTLRQEGHSSPRSRLGGRERNGAEAAAGILPRVPPGSTNSCLRSGDQTQAGWLGSKYFTH